MNNEELAKELATKASLTEEQALAFVNAFAETVSESLRNGEKVVITDFGSFSVRPDKSIQFTPASRVKNV